jgi:hypothetical protein
LQERITDAIEKSQIQNRTEELIAIREKISVEKYIKIVVSSAAGLDLLFAVWPFLRRKSVYFSWSIYLAACFWERYPISSRAISSSKTSSKRSSRRFVQVTYQEMAVRKVLSASSMRGLSNGKEQPNLCTLAVNVGVSF